jgi:hypothetical protein
LRNSAKRGEDDAVAGQHDQQCVPFILTLFPKGGGVHHVETQALEGFGLAFTPVFGVKNETLIRITSMDI